MPNADILKCFGDSDHMHSGRAVTFAREQSVFVDNYSLNRVVNLNEGAPHKFMITNNIAKQSSRMVARYTSMFPEGKYLQVVLNMLFFPFVTLVPNKIKSRYQALQLARKKTKIVIGYDLSNQEVEAANQIRFLLRSYMELNAEVNKNISYTNLFDKV